MFKAKAKQLLQMQPLPQFSHFFNENLNKLIESTLKQHINELKLGFGV